MKKEVTSVVSNETPSHGVYTEHLLPDATYASSIAALFETSGFTSGSIDVWLWAVDGTHRVEISHTTLTASGFTELLVRDAPSVLTTYAVGYNSTANGTVSIQATLAF